MFSSQTLENSLSILFRDDDVNVDVGSRFVRGDGIAMGIAGVPGRIFH